MPPADDAMPSETENACVESPSEAATVAYVRQQAPARETERLGDILRSAREHRGETIYAISDLLRIRPNFLAALENSRYNELPVEAYVVGFLRCYANHLGLDGKAAVDQYRREMAGRRNKPQLHMPQPISEGRAPTVALLIGAVIAALLLYIVWYSLSSSSRTAVDAPPSLEQTQSPPAAASTGSSIAPNVATTSLTAQGIAIDAKVPAESSSAPSPTATEPSASKENATKENKAAATVATSTPSAQAMALTQQQPTPKQETPSPTSSQPPQVTGSTAAPATSAPTASDEDKAPEGQQPAAKTEIPASATTANHITIRAVEESWVLVADRRGNTLIDKILKAGETYDVPQMKGLKLTTGNGGGIVLNLNGVDLPPVGQTARIVRNVSLDPEKLKGRLTPETP